MGIGAPTYRLSSVGRIKFAHLNLQISHACYTFVFMANIARGQGGLITVLDLCGLKPILINLRFHYFGVGEWVFMGKEGARFGVVH